MFEGGCECGRIRFRIEGEPISVHCCHCRQCQKITGSAFALNAMIEAERVEVVAGAEALEGKRGRCPDCQALLWGTHRFFGESILFLRVGTLDEGEKLAPNAHFFTRSKHSWVSVPEGVRAFETLPGESDPPLFGPEQSARVEAARRG
jgi:hypothetical protein